MTKQGEAVLTGKGKYALLSQMNTSQIIQDYFGGNMAALASAIGISRQAVGQWGSTIPAERVIPLCEFLGWQLKPHQVRPDLYPNEEDGIRTKAA